MLPQSLLALVLSIVSGPTLTHASDTTGTPTCADLSYPNGDGTDCKAATKNITVITPGETIFAKLQCLGCPTVEVHNPWSKEEFFRRVKYTEENALVGFPAKAKGDIC